MTIDALSKQDLNITKDETSSKTHHHFTIRLPSARFYSAVDEQLQRHQKTATIKGFRRGKVPLDVIKQRYQNSSEQDVLRAILSRAVDVILQDNKLHPLTTPQIKAVPPQRQSDDLTATITILTAHVPAIDYGSVAIKRYRAEPSEQDIDKALAQLKHVYRRFEPITETRPPKLNERVTLSYTATSKASPQDSSQDNGKTQKGTWNVDMVPPQQAASPLHRALIEALPRHKKGDTFTVETRLDPQQPDTVHITATIDDISQGSPLSEQDMLTTFKAKDQKDLRNTLRLELQKQADELSAQNVRRDLWQALNRTVSIDLPDEYLQQARSSNSESDEKAAIDTDSLRLYALSRHIATQNQLFPTADAIEPQMQALLKAIESDKNQDKKSLTPDERERLYHRLHASMTQNNIDAFLLTKVHVQDHTVPFNQLFEKDASAETSAPDKKSSLIT
ncbi:MAG: hypothetical protein GDA50_02995 [Alphaproteobacteria bacterium GM202ARS2]|nr:hypothetical protein [Alphaproteobacteria bacterium GM202ARS2]